MPPTRLQMPHEVQVILGAILRHGATSNFPHYLREVVKYDEARDSYRISDNQLKLKAVAEGYGHYTSPTPLNQPNDMKQFWIANGWYRYQPQANEIILRKADWREEEKRLEAIRTMVAVTGKEPHDIDSTDFEKHRLGSMIGKYYSASPTEALKKAGFWIDLTKVRKKPNKFKDDKNRVKKGILKWTKDKGYRVQYESNEGKLVEVIELPRKLEDLEGGISWVEALKPYGGMAALSEITGCPILIKTTGRENGAMFYLRHPVAFRHHALELIRKRGWLDEEEKTIRLPKPITTMRDDRQMQALFNAIYYMHRQPEENAHDTLSRLVGMPVTAVKRVGGPKKKQPTQKLAD